MNQQGRKLVLFDNTFYSTNMWTLMPTLRLSIKRTPQNLNASLFLDDFLKIWGFSSASRSRRIINVPMTDKTSGSSAVVYETSVEWDPIKLIRKERPVEPISSNIYFWSLDNLWLVSLIDTSRLMVSENAFKKAGDSVAQRMAYSLVKKILPKDKELTDALLEMAEITYQSRLLKQLTEFGAKLKADLDRGDPKILETGHWRTYPLFDWESQEYKPGGLLHRFHTKRDKQSTGICTIAGRVFRGEPLSEKIRALNQTLQSLVHIKMDENKFSNLFRICIIQSFFGARRGILPIQININHACQVQMQKRTPVLQGILAALVGGSGPFLVKMFQELKQAGSSLGDGFSDALSSFTEKIFDGIPTITDKEKQLLVEKLRVNEPDLNETDLIWGSAASLGQIAFWKGQVVKFIKPSSVFMFACEIKFLLTEIWDLIAELNTQWNIAYPDLIDSGGNAVFNVRRVILNLISSFCQELSTDYECKSILSAKSIYTSPIQVVDCIYQNSENGTLIMSKAPGVSLHAWMNGDQTQHTLTKVQSALNCMSHLLGKFVNGSVIMNVGFHNDLHPGNIFIDFLGDQATLTLIDFGGFTRLDPSYARKMLAFSIKAVGADASSNRKVSLARRLLTARNIVFGVSSTCGGSGLVDPENITKKVATDLLFSERANINSMLAEVIRNSENLKDCIKADVNVFARSISYIINIMTKIHQLQPRATLPDFGSSVLTEINPLANVSEFLTRLSRLAALKLPSERSWTSLAPPLAKSGLKTIQKYRTFLYSEQIFED